VELLVSISALALALMAAYAAQMSAVSLSSFARETDMATYASTSAMDMVTARPFLEMIDPNPPSGSVDPNELKAMQPPYDPRGTSTYITKSEIYPDAPKIDYVAENSPLFDKVLSYGARIWEPVGVATTKTDPSTNTSYKVYPLGTLQKPKVLVWFESRPTLLNGGTGPFESTVIKNNSLGFFSLVPQLSDPSDISSSMPTTVVTAVGWFTLNSKHTDNDAKAFNPLAMFVPPSDGSGTFSASDTQQLETMRTKLKNNGLRIQYNKTVLRP
jgi:hypothetical protein